ncbi:MAG: hypothetical protein QOF57_1964, partial [Frankiaceae bacterium]|nr:hypothetical protein [Frankiaceae bacterium]
YDAAMTPGVTYPDGHATTGQPLYTALLRHLDVTVLDSVTASDGSNPGAPEAAVTVTVTNSSGWTATVADTPVAPVGSAGIRVPVDVPAVTARLAAVARETGAAGSDGTLTVSAVFTADGLVAGRSVTSKAEASYALSVSSLQVRPVPGANGGATGGTGGTATGGGAAAAKPTSVTVPTTVPRTWSWAKLSVPVGEVRLPAALLAVVAVVVALVAGAGRSGEHPAMSVVSIIGARRVDVSEIALGSCVVDVTSAAALVRIADRYDRLVLSHVSPRGSTFVVNDDGTSYRLVVPCTGARHLRVA